MNIVFFLVISHIVLISSSFVTVLGRGDDHNINNADENNNKKMFAVVATGISENISSVVQYIQRDVPTPGIGEVLIEVKASSVNPVDWKIITEKGLPLKFPHVLGFDVSGIVASVGSLTSSRLKAGDEIWVRLNSSSSSSSSSCTHFFIHILHRQILGRRGY